MPVLDCICVCFFFSSRRRHTRYIGDWSSDVCSSDLIRIGGQITKSAYQYTLQGTDTTELYQWAPKVEEKLRSLPGLVDVTSEIGRASCRERVEIGGVIGAWKKEEGNGGRVNGVGRWS